MQFTTIDDFFNPDDPFCYPLEWKPAMLAGFTAEQAAANDPVVLQELWRLPPSLIGASAPIDTPLCITGCQNTPVSGAREKDIPSSTAGRETTPGLLACGLFDAGLRHGCPPAAPVAPLAVAPVITPAPSLPGAALLPCGPVSGLVVDFLNFTYPLETDSVLDGLKLLLGDDWQEMEKPFYGYRAGARCGNIVLLWAGSTDAMGIHVQISGQGCRELEGRHSAAGGGDLDWRTWFFHRVKEGARFSQTHMAFDDLDGMISVQQVTDAFRAGQCVTRFSTFEPRETFGASGERTSQGFYFGKRAQDTSICIYDKKLEQEHKDKGKAIDVEEYERKVKAMENGWTRVELRNRNKRSHALVLRIIEEGWGIVAGVLRGYLDIRVPEADTNKSRWSTVSWWDKFCSFASRARLIVEGVVKTMQTQLAWLDRQVGTVLAMVNTVLPDPVGFLQGIMERGAARFGKRHLNIMSAYLLAGKASIPAASLRGSPL